MFIMIWALFIIVATLVLSLMYPKDITLADSLIIYCLCMIIVAIQSKD